MKKKTPQEKKALSYAKDCRNHYGEHDKGSRNSVRRHKKVQNQVYWRKVNQVLNEIEIENAETVEIKAKSISKGRWKKCADTPLKFFVEFQKDMEKRRAGRKGRGNLLKSNLSEKFFSELKKRK